VKSPKKNFEGGNRERKGKGRRGKKQKSRKKKKGGLQSSATELIETDKVHSEIGRRNRYMLSRKSK